MEDLLTDREVALILTVLDLWRQNPTPSPTHVQEGYRRAKAKVEEALKDPLSYPENRRHNTAF